MNSGYGYLVARILIFQYRFFKVVKMTTEPPQGLQTNLARLYRLVSDDDFESSLEEVKHKYKKMLFSLVWFHALILERRKFKSLGWNIPYEFNNSDFIICESILRIYIDEYPEKTPFEAIKYLIAEANCGRIIMKLG